MGRECIGECMVHLSEGRVGKWVEYARECICTRVRRAGAWVECTVQTSGWVRVECMRECIG